jgi:lysozyme
MTKAMIDVSAYQHPNGRAIPWPTVRHAGIDAVMIQVSEGQATEFDNPYAKADAEGVVAAGMEVGYYHFATPVGGSAKDDAQRFADLCKPLPKGIAYVLDLEAPNGLGWAQLATWGEVFLAELSALSLPSPLYSNPDWLANLRGAPWGHKLWLAQWGSVPPKRSVWAWQYTGAGTVAGISGPVDRSVLYG